MKFFDTKKKKLTGIGLALVLFILLLFKILFG